MLKKIGSRKFLVTLGAVMGAMVASKLGVPHNIIEYSLMMAGTYVGVEGLIDFAAVIKKTIR